jgi:hypothetical protein
VDTQHSNEEEPGDLEDGRAKVDHSIIFYDTAKLEGRHNLSRCFKSLRPQAYPYASVGIWSKEKGSYYGGFGAQSKEVRAG